MEHMNQHKKNILSLLFLQCNGRENASKSGEITGMTGIGDREIREIIRELRREGHPIGSGPRGFWWINNSGELKEYFSNMKSRAFDMLKTVSIQERSSAAELAGQLGIALENG
jgi:hypothetical protein